MAVQKYVSIGTDGCTEILKHVEGCLYRNMEACGGVVVQKYESMRRDGCTMYRNMEE